MRAAARYRTNGWRASARGSSVSASAERRAALAASCSSEAHSLRASSAGLEHAPGAHRHVYALLDQIHHAVGEHQVERDLRKSFQKRNEHRREHHTTQVGRDGEAHAAARLAGQLLHLLQRDRDNLLGKTDLDLFPREQAVAYRAVDQRVLAEGGPIEAEEYAPLDDGLHTYLSVKAPLLDSNGKRKPA